MCPLAFFCGSVGHRRWFVGVLVNYDNLNVKDPKASHSLKLWGYRGSSAVDKLGVVAHVCYPSAWEGEARRLGIQGPAWATEILPLPLPSKDNIGN